MPYAVRFLDQAEEHLARLKAGDRARVLDAIVRQLVDQPTVETRNRTRMRANPLAQYRLRVAQLRVYYDVEESESLVVIKAVGIKVRDKVIVGGEEIKL